MINNIDIDTWPISRSGSQNRLETVLSLMSVLSISVEFLETISISIETVPIRNSSDFETVSVDAVCVSISISILLINNIDTVLINNINIDTCTISRNAGHSGYGLWYSILLSISIFNDSIDIMPKAVSAPDGVYTCVSIIILITVDNNTPFRVHLAAILGTTRTHHKSNKDYRVS